MLKYKGRAGQAVCGNGTIDAGEDCDGTNLNGKNCGSVGNFSGGILTCTSSCTFDTSQCDRLGHQAQCGDGKDNDGDGKVDLNDPGCLSIFDNSETDPLPPGSFNPPFPRTAIFNFGGAVSDWYEKFDLVLSRDGRSSEKPIWLPMRDFNKAAEGVSDFPEAWYLHHSDGKRIELYGPGDEWVNFSGLGERYTGVVGGIQVNNERMIDWYPKYLKNLMDSANGDGIATDGLYYKLHLEYNPFADVDLDSNGLNDMTESGKGKGWVIDHWSAGVDSFFNDLRNILGQEKLIVVNTGSGDMDKYPVINGLYYENSGGIDNWNNGVQRYYQSRDAVHPPLASVMGHESPDMYFSNNYSFVRNGLARAMLLDMYYEFSDQGAGEHNYVKYFDEFDLDVGDPTEDLRELKSGVWVKAFKKGLVIANNNGFPVTVYDWELTAAGYADTYYRFKGGQDPLTNDGSLFSSIQLEGSVYTAYGGNDAISGDGIVLVKSPQTVIADIIVDNERGGTSPGSEEASLSAGWVETCDGNNHYTLRCVLWGDPWNQFETAISTSSSDSAVFTPNIGVEGNYEVWEWHGTLNTTMASKVKHAINDAAFVSGWCGTSCEVNQRGNAGGWNYLGTYHFKKGTAGNVKILADGADGTVMADAVKFKFREE